MVEVVTSDSIQELLGTVEAEGVESLDLGAAERLEGYILEANEAAAAESRGEGSLLVEDAIYDRMVEILKQISPDSAVLNDLWEADGDVKDWGELLANNPMKSISTAKSWDSKEFQDFESILPDEERYNLHVAYKVNGHGIRVVYEKGNLVMATSRARASAGRDLTRQMRNILGDFNEELSGFAQVEVRGEIALPMSSLEEARKFNPTLKSAFSAVSSLIKPSSVPEENTLLTFLAYGVYFVDDTSFSTKQEEYGFLEDMGFSTPWNYLVEVGESESVEESLASILATMENEYHDFGYFCDGLVAEIDDRDLFKSMGSDEKFNYGNVALKIGIWSQDMYTGIVQSILWTPGKSKMAPVAIVSEEEGDARYDHEDQVTNLEEIGVPTAQGNKVRRVPLYEPKNILILQAYPGRPLSFRYGGEAGVVPCNSEGQLLTDDAVRNTLLGA